MFDNATFGYRCISGWKYSIVNFDDIVDLKYDNLIALSVRCKENKTH